MDHPVCVAALPGCEVEGTLAVADADAARGAGAALLLCRDKGALALQVLDQPWKPLSLQFGDGKLGFRLAQDRVRHERLVKALGGMPRPDTDSALPTVCDATAGLGRDALVIAQAGFRVRMVERSPVLHALLQDALRRLAEADAALAARLELHLGDAVSVLAGMDASTHVYLDPMFPRRDKRAAVKKDLRILQLLLADQSPTDPQALLQAARERAHKRVVVKRPARAESLTAEQPAFSVPGKAVRFDVYTR